MLNINESLPPSSREFHFNEQEVGQKCQKAFLRRNKKLPDKLKHEKDTYRVWKQGQVTTKEY